MLISRFSYRSIWYVVQYMTNATLLKIIYLHSRLFSWFSPSQQLNFQRIPCHRSRSNHHHRLSIDICNQLSSTEYPNTSKSQQTNMKSWPFWRNWCFQHDSMWFCIQIHFCKVQHVKKWTQPKTPHYIYMYKFAYWWFYRLRIGNLCELGSI